MNEDGEQNAMNNSNTDTNNEKTMITMMLRTTGMIMSVKAALRQSTPSARLAAICLRKNLQ